MSDRGRWDADEALMSIADRSPNRAESSDFLPESSSQQAGKGRLGADKALTGIAYSFPNHVQSSLKDD
eukprot:CAMPEP_0197662726 /NCGR_PEP_ID=MMETSP1338-20131121/54535_1 /TAXON_ID=43686 ORGANISM="Pelagodinium beii, Strain RCC1491" /NCGR_SAMPLE_ID=MMETSP1338 /ASSEMBLY_ACC=CAM_ASM_000754 /LENGTH=67 /DNA_ID=CAMNT_0043240693 /DNA_START=87 /DNA_END=287 /DNA_ORIENTATION=+